MIYLLSNKYSAALILLEQNNILNDNRNKKNMMYGQDLRKIIDQRDNDDIHKSKLHVIEVWQFCITKRFVDDKQHKSLS